MVIKRREAATSATNHRSRARLGFASRTGMPSVGSLNSLVVSFAQEEEQPPRLHRGQDERRYPDKSDEATGGLGSPLLHDEALLRHRDVLVLPHPAREQQAFPPEVLRVLGQRHHGDEAEHEG